MSRVCHWGAVLSLIALILMSLAWELWLAPLRPGGSWLVLKAALYLLPLFGLLRERVYTYQWSSMFILLPFAEGVTRGWSDSGLSQRLAWAEVALTVFFFVCVLGYIRGRRQALAHG